MNEAQSQQKDRNNDWNSKPLEAAPPTFPLGVGHEGHARQEEAQPSRGFANVLSVTGFDMLLFPSLELFPFLLGQNGVCL